MCRFEGGLPARAFLATAWSPPRTSTSSTYGASKFRSGGGLKAGRVSWSPPKTSKSSIVSSSASSMGPPPPPSTLSMGPCVLGIICSADGILGHLVLPIWYVSSTRLQSNLLLAICSNHRQRHMDICQGGCILKHHLMALLIMQCITRPPIKMSHKQEPSRSVLHDKFNQ
ncbi:hypothetical protein AAC387_Pa04g1453 [Persea americana]